MAPDPSPKHVTEKIRELERRLSQLDAERISIQDALVQLRITPTVPRTALIGPTREGHTEHSGSALRSAEQKLAIFRALFRGRDDVYARRWEYPKAGRSGYSPVCAGGLSASKIDPRDRVYLPLTDAVIRNHIRGTDPEWRERDFVIGVYPLLQDETCWFLAADFDKSSWRQDAVAFMETCHAHEVTAAMERSRSGNGAHVWIFFAEPISAMVARQLGALLLTRTMERRPEIGLDSYDRFFPNQDTMPKGKFGNLIALPLQKRARDNGNTLFLDKNCTPYEDQIEFLASLIPNSQSQVTGIVRDGAKHGNLVGVRTAGTDVDDEDPWTAPPSRQSPPPVIAGPLPQRVNIVNGNQIYVSKEGLTPPLTNRLIRIAAFQNPEFYKAQAMRFNTFGKPRIIACAEDFSQHIGLPRGCLDEAVQLFESLKIGVEVKDERVSGVPLVTTFRGTLRPEQDIAAARLLATDTGVLAATTAFGKTVIAAHLIAKRGVSTLVLVHRRQLMDQWIERMTEFLDIDRKSIGQIGGGKRKATGILDIAVIQSLFKQGVVDDIVGNYGHLVVDECHHISAQSFEQVARGCKARYVTGLSATTIRKDGHHPIIFMQCGPVRYQVDARKQAQMRPFDHIVFVRLTAFNPEIPPELVTIQRLYNDMISDKIRNEMIVKDVCNAASAGRSPVVLTERIDHLDLLVDILTPHVSNLVVFRGGMGVRQRRAVMKQLDKIPLGEPRVLLSTGRYLGEGFDDARLDTLFLVMPISWRGTLAQYSGRLHRLHDSKREVIIYDYADLNVPMLARMHEKRLSGYRALGYRTTLAAVTHAQMGRLDLS